MRKIVTGLLLSAFMAGTSALADDSNNYGTTPGSNDTFTSSPTLSDSWTTDQQAGTAGKPTDGAIVGEADKVVIENNDPNATNGLNTQEAGTAGDRYTDTGMSSEASSRDTENGDLDRTVVHFQPQAGVIDVLGAQGLRAAIGLTTDFNLASMINRDAGKFFFGPATGVIFSHFGNPNSNLFGTDANTGGSEGSNVLLIPANLKVGFAAGNAMRFAVRGGGNITYRSVGNSVNFGASSAALGANSGWRIFPNVGADLEVGISKNVSLMLRPDYTFTPGDDFITATLGLGLNLG